MILGIKSKIQSIGDLFKAASVSLKIILLARLPLNLHFLINLLSIWDYRLVTRLGLNVDS